jgi:hypothetical protein
MPDPNQELELQRHMPCSYYVLSELVWEVIVHCLCWWNRCCLRINTIIIVPHMCLSLCSNTGDNTTCKTTTYTYVTYNWSLRKEGKTTNQYLITSDLQRDIKNVKTIIDCIQTRNWNFNVIRLVLIMCSVSWCERWLFIFYVGGIVDHQP